MIYCITALPFRNREYEKENPVVTEEQARNLPYPVMKTPKGYRRPISFVEKKEIRKLVEMDFIVIRCGGRGIPVIRENRSFSGVDAVTDKDLASAKLAEEVGADIFLIASDVPGAALHYGTDREEFLRTVSVKEMEQHLKKGHFPPGSMSPKQRPQCSSCAAAADGLSSAPLRKSKRLWKEMQGQRLFCTPDPQSFQPGVWKRSDKKQGHKNPVRMKKLLPFRMQCCNYKQLY